MLRIIVPTFQDRAKIEPMIAQIRNTTRTPHTVHATCYNASAAENRNRGLACADVGDTIIMLDDDITGFSVGWESALIEPFLHGAALVSARLMSPNGHPGPCNGDTGDMQSDFFVAKDGHVPSAAIAFVKDDLIFDENYGGAGYEDTDFCEQIRRKYGTRSIVINNRCRLIHMNESKHAGANGRNGEYYRAKWAREVSLEALVFSKDRPMQLDMLLQSMRDFMPALHNTIHVLARATAPEYARGYELLEKKYRNVWIHQEHDFVKQTRDIVAAWSKRYCMMFADDEVFVNAPDMYMLMGEFADDVACISLRLGKSVNYCQPARKAMPLPQFIETSPFLKWDWTRGDQFTDWYYPRSVIGTVHRTQAIKQIVADGTYRNPNELEVAMGPISGDMRRRFMISMPYSCIVCIPANRTSELSNTPQMGISASDLAEKYADGYRIWAGDFYGMQDNNSCFPEINFLLHRPRISIHWERTGRVNGCQKVALNTIEGLRRLSIPFVENVPAEYNGALHMVSNVRALPRNTVIGPESMVLPNEHADMWRLYRNWTTPCDWVTRSYRTSPLTEQARITEWPAGIDTDRFNADGRAPEYDCFVYFKTVTKQTSIADLNGAKDVLTTRGLTSTVIEYGNYAEEGLIHATKKARFAIWLAGTESQNIALLEVLASNVPVFVIEQSKFEYHGFSMDGASSAPYFDDRCGVICQRDSIATQFDAFLARVDKYSPRDYVLEHFTLEKCARAYHEMLINVEV